MKEGIYYITVKGKAKPERVIADSIIEPLPDPQTDEDNKYILQRNGEIVASYRGDSVEGWRREEKPRLTPIVVG